MKKRIGFALVCIGCIVAGMGFGLDFYLEEMAERHPILLYPSDCDFTNHKWAGLIIFGIGGLPMFFAGARSPRKRLL